MRCITTTRRALRSRSCCGTGGYLRTEIKQNLPAAAHEVFFAVKLIEIE
jgi:hypothetical protein